MISNFTCSYAHRSIIFKINSTNFKLKNDIFLMVNGEIISQFALYQIMYLILFYDVHFWPSKNQSPFISNKTF